MFVIADGMNLPGRLRASTLGDLLGKLHRARVSGVLELRETEGSTAGRRHRIHVRDGLVRCVEADTRDSLEGPPTLREIPSEDMSRADILIALDAIDRLKDAELTFHVSRRTASSLPPPLSPAEFLHGRPRARDRIRSERVESGEQSLRRRALATLGLPSDATLADVHRAFKSLALVLHPDRHPQMSPEERAEVQASFARAAQAYHVLVA